MEELISEHLATWTGAQAAKRAGGRGRGRKRSGAQSHYGIKKLRELILELAVRGKLVPQDPADEPASVLLERIAAEKGRLIKAGKIKRQKKLPEISEEEKPFGLPQRWEWTRIDELALHSEAGWSPKCEPTPRIKDAWGVLKVSAVTWGRYNPKENKALPVNLEPKPEYEVMPGDFLISRANTAQLVARSVVVPDDSPACLMMCDKIIRFVFSSEIYVEFINHINASTFCRDYYARAAGGTSSSMKNVSRMAIRKLTIPLPPLPEQHRIVAKVDELMTLCDRLEKQQTNNAATHQALLTTLLNALTASADHAEFTATWQRIAEHFDTLFTTEQSIDQLKQTILQLAVMGKLVPQDPDDEPASVLLEKIAVEKTRLVKEKKIKRQKKLPEILEEEKAFGLPAGWELCRLQEIVFLLGDGLHGTPEYSPTGRYYFVNGNNLKDGKIVIKPETKTVAQDQYDKYKKSLGENTVLVSINGTIGNVAFYNNEKIVLGKSACYFNLAGDIYKQFVKIVIIAPHFLNYAVKNATGSIIKNLGLNAMNRLPVALPPAPEQHRIVTKVDELLTLCDTLKTRLQQAQTTQVQLADTLVEQAVA